MNNAPKTGQGSTDKSKENDPKKVIDTPQEVQQSNDEKIDQDFPGYPHNPASEKVLNNDGGKTK